MTYSYDGDGRRVAKVGSKLYWYGSGGEILAETDAAGDPENDYIFFGDKRIAMVPNNTDSNGGFEQGMQGWTTSGVLTAQVLTDPTKAHTGNNYLEVSTSTAGETFVLSTQQIPVSIGQTLVYGGWRFREVGPSSYSRWEMTVTSVNGSATSHPPDDSIFGSWLFQTGSYTVPSWMECPCSAVLKIEMLTSAGYVDTSRFDDGFLTVGQFAETGAVYYAEDLLGTSRIVTQSNGAVCYDADFYPYGGERPYTNTCPPNYKFEGMERDTETGNDDFGARYYSNRFGRWLSSDWSALPTPVPYANLTNPQTLNLYSMVSDDPESFADLDGHSGGVTDEATPPDDGGCNHRGGTATNCTGQTAQQQVSTQKPQEPLNPFSMMLGAVKEMTVNAVVDFATMVDQMRQATFGGPDFQLQDNRLEPKNNSEAGGMVAGAALSFLIPGPDEAKGASVVEHIFANPSALGKFGTEAHAAELGSFLEQEGWKVGTLGKGSHAGQGMRALELNTEGKMTGRAISWHPGGGHHGPSPYWKVSSPARGMIRIGPQFLPK